MEGRVVPPCIQGYRQRFLNLLRKKIIILFKEGCISRGDEQVCSESELSAGEMTGSFNYETGCGGRDRVSGRTSFQRRRVSPLRQRRRNRPRILLYSNSRDGRIPGLGPFWSSSEGSLYFCISTHDPSHKPDQLYTTPAPDVEIMQNDYYNWKVTKRWPARWPDLRQLTAGT